MTDRDDALSDILRLVRLRACVYFIRDMPAPWGMDIPATPNGPLHMVLEGHCLVRSGGRTALLHAGDAVLLPQGAPHVMADANTSVPEPANVALPHLMNGPGPVTGPVATRMLCGHFEWDEAFDHPIFRELPDLMVVSGMFDREGAGLFRSVVDLIASEQAGRVPGAGAVADRMGEILFVSLLRAWMSDRNPDRGVLATMNDARLSRALSHMHDNHGTALDLKSLARVAGMSRTAFAVHFRDKMGMPPATYLAEWRLLQARRLLVGTEIAIPEIVERVGYGSDAAFSRAFKRRFGESPARLRRAAAS